MRRFGWPITGRSEARVRQRRGAHSGLRQPLGPLDKIGVEVGRPEEETLGQGPRLSRPPVFHIRGRQRSRLRENRAIYLHHVGEESAGADIGVGVRARLDQFEADRFTNRGRSRMARGLLTNTSCSASSTRRARSGFGWANVSEAKSPSKTAAIAPGRATRWASWRTARGSGT
jgi:hypothetical protein